MAVKLDDAGLEQMAATESRAWVERLVEQLAQQGRQPEGGWPGTLSEARLLAKARVFSDSGSVASVITGVQFEQLVKVVYVRARKEWLARANGRGSRRRPRASEEIS